MFPNLSKLRDEPAPAAPDSSAAYEDRLDDVVGGCTPTTARGIACYDDWAMTLTRRILDHPSANTLVLLSVGLGVLELRAVKQILAVRAENNQSALQHLVLIDPGLEAPNLWMMAAYDNALLGVDVQYYTGDRAYDDALKVFVDNPEMRVAAIGALNFGYMMSTHQIHRNLINTMIALVELIERRNEDASTIYVVQAFRNMEDDYVLRDNTASAFAMRFIPLLNEFTRLHMEEFYRRPASRTRL